MSVELWKAINVILFNDTTLPRADTWNKSLVGFPSLSVSLRDHQGPHSLFVSVFMSTLVELKESGSNQPRDNISV